MPIEIKHRHTGEIIRTVETDTLRGADLSGANLGGANLRRADLSGADLSAADLSGADLRGANLRFASLRDASLRGADLSGAYLRDASLSGADLSGANLSGASLRGADLSGADLRGADLPPIPIVDQLDSKILTAIETGGSLEMEDWHMCETTHCRYGWAITLAGEAGKVLESQIGPLTAGALIYWKSAGYIPPYTGNNEEVLADIRAHAAREVNNVD